MSRALVTRQGYVCHLLLILSAYHIKAQTTSGVKLADCDHFFQTLMWNANDSDVSRLKMEVHHPFLSPRRGIVQSTTYKISIEVTNFAGRSQLFLTSFPVGIFSATSNTTVPCDENGKSILTVVTQTHVFVTWKSPEEKVANDSIDFMAVYTDISGHLTVATASLPWTKGCFRTIKATYDTYGSLDSEDLKELLKECLDVNILIKAVKSRIVLQFQEIILPEKDSHIAVDIETEGTGQHITSQSASIAPRRYVSRDSYLMLRVHGCRETCRFRTIFSILNSTIDCNETYSNSEGVISNPGYPRYYLSDIDCNYRIEASTDSRILLTVDEFILQNQKSCDSDYIQISPVYRTGDVTLCHTVNAVEYMSSNNIINIRYHATGSIGKFRLHFNQLLPCYNSTFLNSTGDVCTSGYFADRNCQYTFYVPLGYEIELEFTKILTSNTIKSTSCSKDYIQLKSFNRAIANLCGNWTNSKEYPKFRSVGNSIKIIMFIENPLKETITSNGFCVHHVAVPVNSSLTSCEYGWIPGDRYCYFLSQHALSWTKADTWCQLHGGHLASITDEEICNLIENIIKNSNLYGKVHSFWIGANDITYDNYFSWADNQQFVYSNWFPGWKDYQNYNAQPSDDGLSQEDCVEIRDLFRYSGKGSGKTDKFYWNDRDCNASNYFLCQRPKPGVVISPTFKPNCNRTISLSTLRSRDAILSPGYPNNYPTSVECHYEISCPHGESIDLQFTDLHLENHEDCQYDYLQLEDGSDFQRRYCGDWRKKVKLLRRISKSNFIRLTFVADFSHSYAGFRAEIFLFKKKSSNTLCEDKLFHPFENHCYLIAPFPEVSWSTAYRICEDSQTYLSTIENIKEEKFIYSLIKSTEDYMSGAIYWLGAKWENSRKTWKWIDGKQAMSIGDTAINRPEMTYAGTSLCLAIQWRRKKTISGLYRVAKDCFNPGRYICKKSAIVLPETLNKTLTASSGTLTSFNYPSHYVNDLHYQIIIKAPLTSRIIFRFKHIDIEWQEDCLYDYILLQSTPGGAEMKVCGQEDDQLDRYDFISDNNTLYVTFHSDYSITSSGFVANWEAVDLSSCNLRQLNVSEIGFIISVGSPGPYLPGIDCTAKLHTEQENRIVLRLISFDVGEYENCSKDYLHVSLGEDENENVILCGNKRNYPSGYTLMSYGNTVTLHFHSDVESPYRYNGFNISYEPHNESSVESVLIIDDNTEDIITSLNYPLPSPRGINYTQRIVGPIGYNIQIKLSNNLRKLIGDCNRGEVRLKDAYSDNITTLSLCTTVYLNGANMFTSMLNSIYVQSWTTHNVPAPFYILRFKIIIDVEFISKTLLFPTLFVDSCLPNPCQHSGLCLVDENSMSQCHCRGPFTGLFCHIEWCDLEPCGQHGQCNMTEDRFICKCQPNYSGEYCREIVEPCNPNPCEQGSCAVTNGTFICHCPAGYEGELCEKNVFRITYKPLGERMLEEPFWLGLITVSVVLLVILCVYCIKRKFADKIEKFLAEEIERSKNNPSPPTARYSLSSNQQCSTPANLSPQTCPKSILNRIRKHSIRSARGGSTSPTDRDMGCNFSFDDILKRAAQQALHSKKTSAITNTSTPTKDDDKKDDEKSRILASLVTSSPSQRRMSLDEFFRMSERKIQLSNRKVVSQDEGSPTENNIAETSFIGLLSPRISRYSAPSFTDFHSVRERSFEQNSSSDSLSGEPRTSEVQAEVSPQTSEICAGDEQVQSATTSVTIQQSPPEISITQEDSPSTGSNEGTACVNSISIDEDKQSGNNIVSPVTSHKSIYLEVPSAETHPIIQIQTISDTTTKPSGIGSPNFRKAEITRKYSVDLPTPKILITSNMGSCDSDETSPPRTPNTVKPMAYLSPLTVICSSADRTISESNLSTSGYSSLSSPGLSRCNSSSPLSDELEAQQNSGTKSRENTSPNKSGSHLFSPSYVNAKSDKAFQFPPTHVYPCLEIFQQPRSAKRRGSISGNWYPTKDVQGHPNLPRFRSPYHQPISRQNSIEDEGIGMEPCDQSISDVENRDAKIAETYQYEGEGRKPNQINNDTQVAKEEMKDVQPNVQSIKLETNLPRNISCLKKEMSSDSDELDNQNNLRFKGQARRNKKSPSPKEHLIVSNPPLVANEHQKSEKLTDCSSVPTTSSTLSADSQLLRVEKSSNKKDSIKNLKQKSCPAYPSETKKWVALPAQRSCPITYRKTERMESVESADSSITSDTEDMFGVYSKDQHPTLRRQGALSEDDGDSEDSSGDTTVLLRKTPNVSLVKNVSKKSDDSASSPRITISLSDSSSIPSLPELFDSASLTDHLVTEEDITKKLH